ncbi:MAG: phenylalanine--tRNA ligase subunit alpha [Calditrichales bacterium]|nr:MAG: phenylalanine--tRNA ligase subunit alpha [Calditrichales bacterium]
MLDRIKDIQTRFSEELVTVTNQNDLEKLKLKYLSRKGEVAMLFAGLKDVAPVDRPSVGQDLNQLKTTINDALETLQAKWAATSSGPALDLTLPGRHPFVGRKHPLTQVLDEIKSIFTGMGFSIEDGPEVENDYYNFEALNIPRNHPARDMQDTLYITEDVVLRTHTSPVQVRVMEKKKPPVKIIAPGRVYRRDTPDASHSPFFHQVEGLVVDQGISFGDLKGVIAAFARKMFGPDTKVRFRPSFFPFTEPSAEYDFVCVFCKGKGCRVCKNTGWVEISGAGMVDPNVFKFVDYDPEKYTGYAFGMGIDRIAMLKYGIHDIRMFFENDIRFLEQF